MPPALLLARGDVAALAAAGLPFGGVGDVACRVEDRRPSAALSATALKMLSSSLRACSDDSRRSTRCFGVEEGSELDSEEEHGCVSVYVYMYVSVCVCVLVPVSVCVSVSVWNTNIDADSGCCHKKRCHVASVQRCCPMEWRETIVVSAAGNDAMALQARHDALSNARTREKQGKRPWRGDASGGTVNRKR